MSRTRTLVVTAALAVGGLTLSACGGDDADPAPAGTEQETDDSMMEDEEKTDDSMMEDEEKTDDSMMEESTTTGG